MLRSTRVPPRFGEGVAVAVGDGKGIAVAVGVAAGPVVGVAGTGEGGGSEPPAQATNRKSDTTTAMVSQFLIGNAPPIMLS